MRLLSFALLLLSAPALAQAPGQPATTTPVAVLSTDTPIETIVADPRGKAVLSTDLPNLLGHPMYESFKTMSLRQLAPYSNGDITDEKLSKVDADLKALK